MRNRDLLYAGILCLGLSCGSAVLYIAANSGFGFGDIPALALWSTPFAVVCSLSARLLTRLLAQSKLYPRLLLSALAGLVVGFCWTLLVATVLGGWFGAFSFPVLLIWCFSASATFVWTGWHAHRSGGGPAVLIALAVSLGLVVFYRYVTAPRPQLVLYMKPRATADDLESLWTTVIGQPAGSATSHDLLPGIAGAGYAGFQGEQATYVVEFQRWLPEKQRDSLIARIQRSPLVEHTEFRVIPMAPRKP